jgi:16S rRNA processing protein RimM
LSDMDWISFGKVGRTHGLKGELKYFPNVPEEVDSLRGQIVRLREKEIKVQSIRGANVPFIIKLEGIDDINSAKILTGTEIFAKREHLKPLSEGDYYRFEIEGLAVFDEEGRSYGFIEEVIPTGSNDIYVVRNGDQEWMLPMIDSVVKSIDLEQKKLIFHRIEGLIEDTPV